MAAAWLMAAAWVAASPTLCASRRPPSRGCPWVSRAGLPALGGSLWGPAIRRDFNAGRVHAARWFSMPLANAAACTHGCASAAHARCSGSDIEPRACCSMVLVQAWASCPRCGFISRCVPAGSSAASPSPPMRPATCRRPLARPPAASCSSASRCGAMHPAAARRSTA